MELELHAWIKNWQKGPNVLIGPGDDAALVRVANKRVVLKVDQLVENVHFVASKLSAKQIGRKAALRPLSDFAAMGALPQFALISLAANARWKKTALRNILASIRDCLKQYNVSVVGGDLARSKAPLNISIFLVGNLANQTPLRRDRAKVGQKIFVTGSLGGSILGKHWKFEPRIKEALHLSKNYKVGGMLDISDGLSLDLWRMCQASKVGARLVLHQLPIAAAAKRLSQHDKKPAWQHALEDGEDYELLFTLPAKASQAILLDPVFRQCGIHEIGEILPGRKLVYQDQHKQDHKLKIRGYVHV